MALDEELNQRLRDLLDGLPGLSEKRMMGGLCFLVDGNMIGAARREKSGNAHFMFRVGKDNEEEALREPGTRPMEHGGRRMGGFIWLDEDAATPEAMRALTSLSVSFVTTLPPK
ncbi:MAG: RNA methyltransferase [Ahrensia sp.]|nr:RNA methyltransferase [Ahrensia sp.]|tara:strand:+ start:8641 stop:8982 length:342 start_codon:yes stop_codon:yes gene_type:complete